MNRDAISRAIVRSASLVKGRVLLDVTLWHGEDRSRIELKLPAFLTYLPPVGSEVLVLQVGGTADHRVALLPDGTGQRLSGLAPGEIGLADLAGNTVRVTAAGIALKHQTSITIEAPAVKLGGPGAVLPVKLADNSAATKVFAQ